MSTTEHNQNLNCFLVKDSFHPVIFPIWHVSIFSKKPFYQYFPFKTNLYNLIKSTAKYHSSASRPVEDLEHGEVRSRKTDNRTRIALSKDTKKQ